jgi:catechol 2,3-dioxygenase-like lactoylglutathione lyase family enzyme
MAHVGATHTTSPRTFIQAVHGIRYQVKDVARSVEFYTQRLGFTVKHQQLPAFANVSLDDVDILLSGPGASGSRPMPGGKSQEPGGWNRIVLRVSDLEACIGSLKADPDRGSRHQPDRIVPAGRARQIGRAPWPFHDRPMP